MAVIHWHTCTCIYTSDPPVCVCVLRPLMITHVPINSSIIGNDWLVCTHDRFLVIYALTYVTTTLRQTGVRGCSLIKWKWHIIKICRRYRTFCCRLLLKYFIRPNKNRRLLAWLIILACFIVIYLVLLSTKLGSTMLRDIWHDIKCAHKKFTNSCIVCHVSGIIQNAKRVLWFETMMKFC